MKKWEIFTQEELKEIVQSSHSYVEVSHKCGYKGSGPNNIKQILLDLNLDTSHFNSNWALKGKFNYTRFKEQSMITPANLLDALIALRGRKCECCGLSTWLDNPIKLEVHHEDGDHYNNLIDNLKLLCPNCHSFTKNWRGGNNKKAQNPVSDEEFINALVNSKNIRQALMKLNLSPRGANYHRAYELKMKYNI